MGTSGSGRFRGGASIHTVGAIHAQQYYEASFSAEPTIGSLFPLSIVGAAIVGVALLAPVRGLGPQVGDLVFVVAALGAIGIALGTLVSLLVSEYAPLLGFMESGYRVGLVLTLLFDVLSAVFLGFLLLVARGRDRSWKRRSTAHRETAGAAR